MSPSLQPLRSFHLVQELPEQVVRVVRPGRRLGMVLHAEHRLASCAAAPRPCRRTGSGASPSRRPAATSGSTAKPWFCDVISTLPVSSSFTGWLAPRWPNFSLKVSAAHRERRESGGRGRCRTSARPTSTSARRVVDRVRRARPGSPGPLLRNTPSGSVASRSDAGVVAGKHADVAAVRAQPPQDVPLHAEVVGGDLAAAASRGARAATRTRRRRPSGGQSNGASQVTPRTRSDPSIGGIAARRVDERLRIDVAGRDDAAHDAGRPQHPRQRARVDVGDGDDVVAHQVVAERACRRASCSRSATPRA